MDKIKLTFPSNPIYLPALRLATASIASTIDLDIDTIEDLKVIVSELYTYLITENEEVKVKFLVDDQKIKIVFKKEKTESEGILSDSGFELKRQILLALADDLIVEEKKIIVIVSK